MNISSRQLTILFRAIPSGWLTEHVRFFHKINQHNGFARILNYLCLSTPFLLLFVTLLASATQQPLAKLSPFFGDALGVFGIILTFLSCSFFLLVGSLLNSAQVIATRHQGLNPGVGEKILKSILILLLGVILSTILQVIPILGQMFSLIILAFSLLVLFTYLFEGQSIKESITLSAQRSARSKTILSTTASCILVCLTSCFLLLASMLLMGLNGGFEVPNSGFIVFALFFFFPYLSMFSVGYFVLYAYDRQLTETGIGKVQEGEIDLSKLIPEEFKAHLHGHS